MKKQQKDACPHLSWVGVNGMMCCRACGKLRLPELDNQSQETK